MIVALVLVAAVAVGGIIGVNQLLNRARSALSGDTQLVAVSNATARRAVKGHPATKLIDKNTTSYWAVSGKGINQVINFKFGRPLHIVGMIVTIRDNKGVAQYWPRSILVRFFDAQGEIKGLTLPLKITPNKDQKFTKRLIDVSGVTSATVTIKRVDDNANGKEMSINEIQFYEPA